MYKWYWDTEKKNEKLQKELINNDPNMKSPLRISKKILKAQYTDEFGGYSKTWFTDGIEKNCNKASSDILDISDDQSYQVQDFGISGLARMVGLDIEAIALELA